MKIIKILIFSALLAFFGGLIVYVFPFLVDRSAVFEEIPLNEGKTLVLSDLHLGGNVRDLTCIGKYLEENNISHLIVNGDLFDYKKNFSEELLKEAKKNLGIKEGFLDDMVYVLALYYHDPPLKEGKKQFKENGTDITALRGVLKLKTENNFIYIFHGDYFIRVGVAALLIDKFGPRLSYENLAKKAIGVKKDDWIILSHSHIPGINYQDKTANPGAWLERIVSSSDTAILIDAQNSASDPKVSLISIPCE